MTKRILSLFLAFALLLPLAVIAQAQLPVKDFANREIKLDNPAKAIVAVMPGDFETLFALGAGDKIVGRGPYCDYPADKIEGIAIVQSGMDLNVEQIVSLKPDLVILTKMAHNEQIREALEKAKLTVYISDAQNLEGVNKVIFDLGTLTGKTDDAMKLVKDMQARFEAIREKAKDKETLSAYYEVSPLQFGLWAAGKGSFMDEIGQMLKLDNIFKDSPAWAQVSEEQVITRNPKLIVTTAMYDGKGVKPEDEIKDRKGWEKISAINDGKIYNVDTNVFSRPGPRLAEAAEVLYKLVWSK